MPDVSVPTLVRPSIVAASGVLFSVSPSVATQSVLVLAANPVRLGLYIYNNSANTVYINFGATASSSLLMTSPILTFADFVMLGPVVYTGQIAAIRNSGSGTLLITELIV